MNGDGHADVAIGSPGLDTVYVIWGGPSGLVANETAPVRSPMGRGVRFGASIAGLGDIDGNGNGELAIGAWAHERERGTVCLFEGRPDGISTARGYAMPPDAGPGARFGWDLAGSGDVDGDGFVDLVVGAPGAAANAGRAYVVFGATSGFADRPVDVIRPLEAGAPSLGFSLL